LIERAVEVSGERTTNAAATRDTYVVSRGRRVSESRLYVAYDLAA
jgi:hypothetical protein